MGIARSAIISTTTAIAAAALGAGPGSRVAWAAPAIAEPAVGKDGRAQAVKRASPGRQTRPPVTFAPVALRAGFDASDAEADATSRREDGVFGSIPIAVGRIGLSDRWAEVEGSAAAPFAACVAEESRCDSELLKRVRAARDVAGRDPSAAVRIVNRAVNASVRYQTDPVAWGQDDYWATARETLGRGAGDCEDFAVLKLGALLALGLPAADMTVVVVKDTVRGIGHAVLSVRTAWGYDILDNLTDTVRKDVEVTGYQPLYSIGAAGAWVHGRRRAAPQLQAAAPPARPELRGSLN